MFEVVGAEQLIEGGALESGSGGHLELIFKVKRRFELIPSKLKSLSFRVARGLEA